MFEFSEPFEIYDFECLQISRFATVKNQRFFTCSQNLGFVAGKNNKFFPCPNTKCSMAPKSKILEESHVLP